MARKKTQDAQEAQKVTRNSKKPRKTQKAQKVIHDTSNHETQEAKEVITDTIEQETQEVQEAIQDADTLQEMQDTLQDTRAKQDFSLWALSTTRFLIQQAAKDRGIDEKTATLAEVWKDKAFIERASIEINVDLFEFLAETEKATGKDKENITISDIEAAIETIQQQRYNIPQFNLSLPQTVLQPVFDAIREVLHSAEIITASENVRAFSEFIRQSVEDVKELIGSDRPASFHRKISFSYMLWEILEREGIENPGGMTLAKIKATPGLPEKIRQTVDLFDDKGNPLTDYAREILEAANKRKKAFEETQETVKAINDLSDAVEGNAPDAEKAEIITKQLPQIIAQSAETLNYPLDKPNSKIWNLLTTAEDGQLSFDFDTAKQGSGKEALIYYTIDFNALESLPELNITKQLTPFDKRVYIIAAALYNAGNEVITATQIYKADHDKLPNDKDLKKINDSLTKMGAAHIYIDNKNEISVNKSYPKFKYDASLLPFERVSAYINGQLTEAAIHLLREPPLITFARERKQIATIDRQLLLAPISKTDANLRIQDYLIERIAHIKNPHFTTSNKMLYAKIFERCGITEKKQKQRAPEKIKTCLDHYTKCGFIKGYDDKTEKDGIIIITD